MSNLLGPPLPTISGSEQEANIPGTVESWPKAGTTQQPSSAQTQTPNPNRPPQRTRRAEHPRTTTAKPRTTSTTPAVTATAATPTTSGPRFRAATSRCGAPGPRYRAIRTWSCGTSWRRRIGPPRVKTRGMSASRSGSCRRSGWRSWRRARIPGRASGSWRNGGRRRRR